MWVELPKNYRDVKPAAVSFNLNDSIPGTSWVWDDDIHEGDRKPMKSIPILIKIKGMVL